MRKYDISENGEYLASIDARNTQSAARKAFAAFGPTVTVVVSA